jgi:UDPglucose 6-dehydrogenase
MNEIAGLCEQVGADIDMIRRGMGSDARIGSQFLFAGIGYGGSCFPKDVAALIKTSEDRGHPLQVLKAVDEANRRQKGRIVEKVRKHFHGELKGRTFAIWGLSFKPNTDDTREAPSLTVIDLLLKEGSVLRVFDPEAMEEMKRRIGSSVTYAAGNYDALQGAEALLVLTEWNEFRRPDFDRMKTLLKAPVIFDGRNIYDPRIMREKGFTYYGIGRGLIP